MGPGCIVRQFREHGRYRSTLPRPHRRHQDVGFVQCTLGGSGLVTTADGREHPVPRGACLLTAMDDTLEYAAAPGEWDFIYMTFFGRAAGVMIADLVARHGHVLRCDPDHRVLGRLRAFTREEVRSDPIDPGTAVRLTGEMLAALVEWNAPRLDGEGRLIEQATRLLGRDLRDPPAIESVAAACGDPREHLTRVFSAELGRPPGRWLRDERLAHAALLLRTSERSVASIAAAVGFQRASSFVAAFREHLGVTPGVYRSTA